MDSEGRAERLSLAAGLVALGIGLTLAAKATHAYLVRPLREYDGWAIWGTKARALYEFDGADTSVFANPYYDAPTHPLLLPSLEAIGFRTLGAFDPVLLHVQLGALAVGFAAAAWVVLRPSSEPLLAGAAILAVLSAPAVFAQLGTNFADIPVAFFVALGIAALAGWLSSQAGWLLVVGAVFLAAGALTKSEGMLFAAAALVPLLALAGTRRRLLWRAGAAAAVVVVAVLPWRLFVARHGLRHPDYELSNLFDRTYLADTWYRVEPVTNELLRQLTNTGSWGLLLPLFGAALVVSALRRGFAPAAFAAAWLVLSFVGLVLIYWITVRPLEHNLFNTSNRTVATLLIGAGLVAPVLVGRRNPATRAPASTRPAGRSPRRAS
jgi:4-amino-4-deoxy-L-arabinose transferase-like glycosyltransferase